MKTFRWYEHSGLDSQSFYLNFIDLDSGFSFEEHTHEGMLEFIYVMSGNLNHVVNDKRFNHPSGSLMLIRSSDRHELKGGNGQCAVLRVRQAYFENMAKLIGDLTLFKSLEESHELPLCQVPEEEMDEIEQQFWSLASNLDKIRGEFIFTRLFTTFFIEYFFPYLMNRDREQKNADLVGHFINENKEKRDKFTKSSRFIKNVRLLK